jgi:hypothetical protein
MVPPPYIGEYIGFFGATGLINSLDFTSGSYPTYDQYASIDLGSVVATIDEPSGFASLATGLVLLAAASSRFRWRAGRGCR